jgi:hypothetical protein
VAVAGRDRALGRDYMAAACVSIAAAVGVFYLARMILPAIRP